MNSEFNNAIVYVVPLIKGFTSRFNDIEYASEFQLELSRWYFENKKNMVTDIYVWWNQF